MHHAILWLFVNETLTTHQSTTLLDLNQGYLSYVLNKIHILFKLLINNKSIIQQNIGSVVFQEMNFEWHVVAVPQTVPEVGHVEEPLKRLSMIENQTQNLVITLHLDPSFKNR